jgi:uncharacterized protein YecE (DUF72 family)
VSRLSRWSQGVKRTHAGCVPTPAPRGRWVGCLLDGGPVPVTHERFLEGAGDVAARFLDALAPLGPKLGSVVLQFPYFKKAEGVTLDAFLARLLPFLDALPKWPAFAVEVRNITFLKPALLDALRDRSTALVLNDHPWVPRPDEWLAIPGVFTAPYVPIRLLGDRYAIEKVTKTWGETVIDKRKVLEGWAKIVKAALAAGRSVTAFANNHFAGHAPASIEGLAEAVQGTKGWP